MESQPRERVLRPVVWVALPGRQDAGGADQGGAQPQDDGTEEMTPGNELLRISPLTRTVAEKPRDIGHMLTRHRSHTKVWFKL